VTAGADGPAARRDAILRGMAGTLDVVERGRRIAFSMARPAGEVYDVDQTARGRGALG
jgi:hypothetical protein